MIAFASAVTHNPSYELYAAPGIRLASEHDSANISAGSVGSLCLNYNRILTEASKIDGLEALVLLHQDAEIVEPEFCQRVRDALADPEVAIVGCVGAVGVRDIAWWEASVTWASHTHRYWEAGGGDFPGLSWVGEDTLPANARTGEVDSIDGFVMALSPWAIENLRFDETLGRMHGYDFDICCQARAVGKKIVTADLRVIHHHSLELVSSMDEWIDAHIELVRKWEGKIDGVGDRLGDWEQRARHAEAEAAGERIRAGQNLMGIRARDRRIKQLEDDIDRIRGSVSWRLTSPLRAVAAKRANGQR